MMREQKLVLTYRDATRHGPSVTSDEEQHRRRPGVLWRDGNMGDPAASDLAIAMILDERRVR